MSLFNYGECNVCKMRKCKKKLVLCNVLPANVCNMIGDYINECWRCEKLKENEKHFFKGFTGVNDDVNRASNQLKFFTIFNKPFLSTHQTCNDRSGKQFKKEIDRIFDKQNVKDKYVFNKMDLQVLKSYCKSFGGMDNIKLLVWVFLSKQDMCFSPFFYSPENTYTYRNREYIVKDLVKKFLIEYVDDLIGGDKIYCDMEGIRQHIDNLFN